MAATAPEQVYDDEIAPMLRAVVEKCQTLGLHMVSHVEWADGATGITQWVPDGASVQMRMTQLAAHAHGIGFGWTAPTTGRRRTWRARPASASRSRRIAGGGVRTKQPANFQHGEGRQ